MSAYRALLASGLCLLLLSACRDREIASYRVPKEKDPEMPMPGAAAKAAAAAPMSGDAMANTAVTTAQGNDLTWTAPAAWKAKPASAMRKGSYAVTGENGAEADLSITAFPGDVGGDLANLNRWRGQIQLPPLAASDLATATTHADINGLHVTVVDFANPSAANAQRILGAIVPVQGATWFFKLTGPDALVAKEKPAFEEFLKTIKAP
jgi:hypothetical protein